MGRKNTDHWKAEDHCWWYNRVFGKVQGGVIKQIGADNTVLVIADDAEFSHHWEKIEDIYISRHECFFKTIWLRCRYVDPHPIVVGIGMIMVTILFFVLLMVGFFLDLSAETEIQGNTQKYYGTENTSYNDCNSPEKEVKVK